MIAGRDQLVRVLVVEDSPAVQALLTDILHSEPGIAVVGVSASGEEALDAVKRLKPDVITMDIHLPKMSGFDATRRIMESCPTPVVIVSGSARSGEASTLARATDAGALAVVSTPAGRHSAEHADNAGELVRAVKLMSEVKVLTRWKHPLVQNTAQRSVPAIQREPSFSADEFRVLAIGASTGGPMVLQTILSRFPADFPIPVLVVQHVAQGFIQWFADWLAQACSVHIQVATHGERIAPGHVYLAPDGAHMTVDHAGKLLLQMQSSESGICPSISHLFHSVANSFGRNAIGVLLTGMGKDGAKELKLMKDEGAVTIVQDKQSSVVNGMPGEALSLGAANYVLSPGQIAEAVMGLVSHRESRMTL